MSIYVGEPRTISTSDMQGPAPDGYHVPLIGELGAVYDILITTFGLTKNGTTLGTYLKMPIAGGRDYNSSNVRDVGTYGNYWSSTPDGSNKAYNLFFFSSDIYPQYSYYRAIGYSVRCFKNTPVIPTSSWTTLYQGSGSAGVFWNSTAGLISVSGDGTTWYTIMDKNLGATTVYNQGDTLTDANCGYFYQRGNNYGFPHSGSVTTSGRVDARNYGPGNYYSSSAFINGNSDWSLYQNDNLRGGVSQGTSTTTSDIKHLYIGANEAKGVYVGATKIRPKIINFATQGPCPDGFHVPTKDDWEGAINVLKALGGNQNNVVSCFKIPKEGYMRNNLSRNYKDQYGFYWTSTVSGNTTAYHLMFTSSNVLVSEGWITKTPGAAIRPFKNESVIPTSSWTKLFGTSIEAGGIFWSASDELISLSSNGTNWITMSDKNLGATSVYNDGDGTSDDKCGYFYQWGNNYGFGWSDTIQSSSSGVNAGTYGPGNYYSSSIFITSVPRDTSNNANLRGGVDGNVPVS